jgi:hypothetical protein
MPKFMTYQRPTPVNKQSWGSPPGARPYQPARKPGSAPAPHKLTLVPLRGGPKSR